MCRCVVVPVVVVCGHFCPVVLVSNKLNNDVTGDRRKQTSLRRSATYQLSKSPFDKNTSRYVSHKSHVISIISTEYNTVY